MGMQGFSLAPQAPGAVGCGGWQVLADGLEHAPTGYFIARHEIAKRRSDGLWMWPAHVMEKDWVAEDEFATAFRLALGVFGIAADTMLDASFREHDAAFAPDAEADAVPVPRGKMPKAGAGQPGTRRRRAAPASKSVQPRKPADKRKRNEAAATRSQAR